MTSADIKVGDTVRVTWRIYGEAIIGRDGNVVPSPGIKKVKTGRVFYVGPVIENCVVPMPTVVRCSLTRGEYFVFYPDSTEDYQTWEIVIKGDN